MTKLFEEFGKSGLWLKVKLSDVSGQLFSPLQTEINFCVCEVKFKVKLCTKLGKILLCI